jgi:tetratricopeptide (TPR) repeat protein
MRPGEYGKAIESFNKAIVIDSKNSSVYCYLGKSYIWYLRTNIQIALNKDQTEKLKILDNSKNAFKKAIEIEPAKVCAFEGLGEYYEILDDYEKVLSNYTKAVELQPGNKDIYRKIGKTYIALNKHDMAKEAFKIFLKDSKASADYNEEYHFISKDRINTYGSEVLLKSNIKWRIVDPILYEGSVGNLKIAEERIGDIYLAFARSGIFLSSTKTEDLLTPKTIKYIINKVNEYSLKNFGSEIIDLNIDIED